MTITGLLRPVDHPSRWPQLIRAWFGPGRRRAEGGPASASRSDRWAAASSTEAVPVDRPLGEQRRRRRDRPGGRTHRGDDPLLGAQHQLGDLLVREQVQLEPDRAARLHRYRVSVTFDSPVDGQARHRAGARAARRAVHRQDMTRSARGRPWRAPGFARGTAKTVGEPTGQADCDTVRPGIRETRRSPARAGFQLQWTRPLGYACFASSCRWWRKLTAINSVEHSTRTRRRRC